MYIEREREEARQDGRMKREAGEHGRVRSYVQFVIFMGPYRSGSPRTSALCRDPPDETGLLKKKFYSNFFIGESGAKRGSGMIRVVGQKVIFL